MVDVKKGSDNSALAQKIRELLKRKEDGHKELKKIEAMLQKEDEEIRMELGKTVREIREEEEDNFKEDQARRIAEEQASLESTVEEEHPEAAPRTDGQFGYSTIDSTALQGDNIGVYDIAKEDVYNKVKGIMDTPAQFRTNEERNFLQGVTYQINRFQREDMYITKKDPEDFLKRTQNIIGFVYK